MHQHTLSWTLPSWRSWDQRHQYSNSFPRFPHASQHWPASKYVLTRQASPAASVRLLLSASCTSHSHLRTPVSLCPSLIRAHRALSALPSNSSFITTAVKMASTLHASAAAAAAESHHAANLTSAASSPSAAASAAAATLWATCAVMFCGAFLTGLPAVLLWKGGAERPALTAGGLGSLLQGRGMRMLSAGLMLGSGLGVVVPEGFFAFVEGAPGEEAAGLPEWCAGAALVAGFVGMLVLQLWLERGGGGAAGAAGPGAGCGHHHHQHHQQQRHDHGHHTRQAPVSGPSYYQQLPTSEGAAGAASTFDVESASTAAAMASSATVAVNSRRTEGTTPVVAGAGGGGGRCGGGGSGTAATPAAHVSLAAMASGADGYNSDDEPAAARRRRGRREKANCTALPTSSYARSSPFDESFAAVDSGLGSDAAAAVMARTLGGAGSADGPAVAGTGNCRTAGTGTSPAQLALGGLLVHSAADGLAVGAASLGGGTSGGSLGLSLTVAAAVMAHKLPVTFGLTSYLREAGWSPGRVLRGLLAFSASAPVAALATFYLLQLMLRLLPGTDSAGGGGDGSSSTGQAVALAVIFSGGTFLAAATQHILPAALEVRPEEQGLYGEPYDYGREGESGGTAGEGSRGTTEGKVGEVKVGGGSGVLPLLLLAAGAGLPLLIAALIPEAD